MALKILFNHRPAKIMSKPPISLKPVKFKDPFSNMIFKPNKHPELKPIFANCSQLSQSRSADAFRGKTNASSATNRNSQKFFLGPNYFETLISPTSLSPSNKKHLVHKGQVKLKLPPIKKNPKILPKLKKIEFNGTFGQNNLEL